MGEEIKQLDGLQSFDACFQFAVENPDLQRLSRQLLLVRMSHMSDPLVEGQRGGSLQSRPGFEALMEPLRTEYLSELATNN